jgi:hypothetical protein
MGTGAWGWPRAGYALGGARLKQGLVLGVHQLQPAHAQQ